MSIFKKSKNKAPDKKESEEMEIQNEEWLEAEGELAVDMYETDEKIIIEAPVAGVKIEDLEVIVEGDTIKIKGKRDRLEKGKKRDYLLQECYWGSFSREIILPVEVDGQKAEAIKKQEILLIKIPKLAQKTEKKIKIKEK